MAAPFSLGEICPVGLAGGIFFFIGRQKVLDSGKMVLDKSWNVVIIIVMIPIIRKTIHRKGE